MKIRIEQRERGHIPLGAFFMLPLFALPAGAWLVDNTSIDLGTCAFKSMLGIPCLTCGATRGTSLLVEGDLAGAIAHQPLIMGVYAALLVWGLTSFALFVVDRRARLKLSHRESTAFKVALVT
ncbi:MAG: DUF2752 domain-containing protein, partial [Persicimonas sp.]